MNPTEPPTLPDALETNSSVFDKVPPDLRRQINKALVDRAPPTYRSVYDKFRLADRGISYHSFYRYARRLRFHAAALGLAELAMPAGADVADLLPQLLAHRLLEVTDDESASPKTIHRLAQAWRIAAATRLTLGRHGKPVNSRLRVESTRLGEIGATSLNQRPPHENPSKTGSFQRTRRKMRRT